jgi:NAD(P)-dependent dehydrogenase (short-subunit alcohol dehydrogenase family)
LAYAAAKAAQTTYSKGLSNEVGLKGIRVNTVAPEFIETSAAQTLIERSAKQAGTDMEAARQTLSEILWWYSYWQSGLHFWFLTEHSQLMEVSM